MSPGSLASEHDEVGPELEAEGERLLPVTALTDQLIVRIEAKNLHQHFPDGSLVFDDDEPFHAEGGVCV